MFFIQQYMNGQHDDTLESDNILEETHVAFDLSKSQARLYFVSLKL